MVIRYGMRGLLSQFVVVLYLVTWKVVLAVRIGVVVLIAGPTVAEEYHLYPSPTSAPDAVSIVAVLYNKQKGCTTEGVIGKGDTMKGTDEISLVAVLLLTQFCVVVAVTFMDLSWAVEEAVVVKVFVFPD